MLKTFSLILLATVCLQLSACSSKNSLIHLPSSLSKQNDTQQIKSLSLGSIDGLASGGQDKLLALLEKNAPEYGFVFGTNKYDAILRGYHSVENDEGNIWTHYFVFDLLNQNGQRLHRLSSTITTRSAAIGQTDKMNDSDYEKLSQTILLKLKNWQTKMAQ